MKNFILHSALLLGLVVVSIMVVLSFSDGYSDPYYLKISSPKQSNLILGISKSAQGLQPKQFDAILNRHFYNYSFAISISPYGETYLNSIKNKLDTSRTNGVFILAIDIWSICSHTEFPNDSLHFRETNSFLKDIPNVTNNPNYKYLIKYFESKYYRILLKKSPFLLHEDGWLEVLLNEEKTSRDRRTSFTLDSYTKKLTQYRLSSLRLEYLSKTIRFLKKYGEVYLVRLPVHPQMFEIENTLYSDFNLLMKPAIAVSNGYLDMTPHNENYIFTDGVHLNRKSGKNVSMIISNWIKKME